MRENELAELMFRMAADRGVDADAAAEELASIALPSFVDTRAFRAAVIQALEVSLRAQVEERLQSIRRRFEMEPVKQSAPKPVMPTPIQSSPVVSSTPVPSMNDLGDLADVTMADLMPPSDATVADSSTVVEEELPADATMVWTTRHG